MRLFTILVLVLSFNSLTSFAQSSSESTDLETLRGQIAEMKEQIDNARSSRNLNTFIFVPSTVVTTLGGVLLVTAHGMHGAEIEGIMKFFYTLIGYPLLTVGGVSSLVSGYKIFVRQHELNKLWEDLTALERELCLLEENDSTTCK